MPFFLLGRRAEAVRHVLHPSAFQCDRIDTAGDHQVVAQDDAVPGFLGGPAAHPGAPWPVEGEVLGGLPVVGGQVVLGEQVGDHRGPGDLAELRLLRRPVVAAHRRKVPAEIPRHIVVRMPFGAHGEVTVDVLLGDRFKFVE
jgi:hypothetical protein